jgi:hypothetical protein
VGLDPLAAAFYDIPSTGKIRIQSDAPAKEKKSLAGASGLCEEPTATLQDSIHVD